MLVMDRPATQSIDFAWLEITPSCQLHCQHCYSQSCPGLGHGKLRFGDWMRIIADLRAMGTQFVQFIGGEPTIHPAFCELPEFAAMQGLSVEVYTNLVSITDRMWNLFVEHRVRIATSFYSASPAIHDEITGLPGSHGKTLASIEKCLSLGLTLRVGMVHMSEFQDIAEAKALLTTMGVKRIGVDRARGVGRGTALISEDPVAALCGKCVNARCVVTASGEVFPCIMARSFSLGNVLEQSITEIIAGEQTQVTTTVLSTAFAQRNARDCGPDDQDCDPECDPQDWPPCGPDCCPETVASCEPSEDDDE